MFTSYPPHGTFVRLKDDYVPDPKLGESYEGLSNKTIFMVMGEQHEYTQQLIKGWRKDRLMQNRCVVVEVLSRDDGCYWETKDSYRSPRWECLEEVKVVII